MTGVVKRSVYTALMPVFYRFHCLVLGLLLPLLWLPKINMITVAGQYAGARVDDGVLLLVACMIIFTWRWELFRLPWYLYALGGFCILGVVSVAWNDGGLVGYAYALRLAEYAVFFVAGSLLANKPRFFAFYLAAYGLVTVIMVILQRYNLMPAFTTEDGLRWGIPSGLTGGTWEVGLVLAMLATAALQAPLSWRHKGLALLLAGLGIAISGARVPFVLLLGIAAIGKNWRRWVVALAVLPLMINFSPVGKRLAMLGSGDNIIAVRGIWNAATPHMPVSDAYPLATATHTLLPLTDLSLLQRTEKTAVAVKLFWHSRGTAAFWIGHGSGSRGPAVDMGYARLLAENGIIGTLLLGSFFLGGLIILPLPTLVLLGNMLTLDAYLAYKVMTVYFLLLGFAKPHIAGCTIIKYTFSQRTAQSAAAEWPNKNNL
ncbi:MAG: hypothetical protein ACK5O1_01325 [Holosporales bacterium]|jgi:hypothetical protein